MAADFPVDLGGLDLSGMDFSGADLQGRRLVGSNLTRASLENADLTGADLQSADLTSANLIEANLTDAALMFADFTATNLERADFEGSRMGYGVVAACDLSAARNLGDVFHAGPTSISTDTLEYTARNLGKQPAGPRDGFLDFLRGAGVRDELLTVVRSWIGSPIEFYSCFISYSHVDVAFARTLYETLRGRGVRCWLDEHQLLPGDNIYDTVDHGIRLWDKVLLCCSAAAMSSWWVDDELGKAYEKERRIQTGKGRKVQLVIPLNLDGSLFECQAGKASKLRERYSPSFVGWEQNPTLFAARMEEVIRALRSDEGGRETPPLPLV